MCLAQRVVCRSGHIIDRETFQDRLSLANPRWKAFADEMERAGTKLRTNPDGDVAIDHLDISYETFFMYLLCTIIYECMWMVQNALFTTKCFDAVGD